MPMKPLALLDVNVLLALAWSDHADHRRVVRWHSGWAPKEWAVCPFVEAGFLRISLNPAFASGRASAATLLEILRRFQSTPGYRRLDDVPDPADARFAPVWERVQGHRQVTDAMLLCIAIARDVHLVTMDAAMAELGDRRGRVIVVP